MITCNWGWGGKKGDSFKNSQMAGKGSSKARKRTLSSEYSGSNRPLQKKIVNRSGSLGVGKKKQRGILLKCPLAGHENTKLFGD